MTMLRIKRFVLVLLILIVLALPPVSSLLAGHGTAPGILVSAGILSLALFAFFFKALWSRRREKKFIDGLTGHEADDGFSEQPLSHELTTRWKEAVCHLRSSRLRLQGNPLYVLPWYMVMGESGSGKTTAIQNSGLSSPLGSPSGSTGRSGTRSCDWWFFEQAVILDTAGRYTTQPDEARDRDEWRVFLTQLSKYRKKESLNGLLVTVAADRLLSLPEAELLAEGRTVRRRIEELMQVLGVRFPVYVLVTKCDLAHGMKTFAGRLPESARKQVMGFMTPPGSDDVKGIPDPVFATLKERLRQVILHMAARQIPEKLDLDLFLFPTTICRLRKGLEPYIHGVFSRNAYREAPFLRGVYFTSARHCGPLLPRTVEKTGPRGNKVMETAPGQSCFLQDLFDTVLPADRMMFAPTRRSQAFRFKTRILGFSAWILAFIVLCSLVSFSFGKTLSVVRQGGKELAEAGSITSLSGHFGQDLNQLNRFRRALSAVESRNRERWLPELGLTQGSQLEKEAKSLFCRKFSRDFLRPFDQKLARDAQQFTDETPSFAVGRTVTHYARRIRLLDNALAGAEIKTLESLASPDFSWLVAGKTPLSTADATNLKNLYLHSLVWQTSDRLQEEKNHLHNQLVQLAGKNDLSLRWMIDWCNENAEDKELTRRSFWGGSRNLPSDVRVKPAFTSHGFQMIMDILDELERSLKNPADLDAKKAGFLSWYTEAYQQTWLRFARSFPDGAATLAGPGEKMAVAKNIAAGRGPFFSLLDVMARELPVCLNDHTAPPEWIAQVLEFSVVRSHVEKPEAPVEKGLARAVKKKGLFFLETATSLAASEQLSLEKLKTRGEAYLRYKQSLENLALISTSRPSAFKLATEVFTEDPAMGQSAFAVSLRHADDVKTGLPHRSGPGSVTARIIDSPINFLWDLAAEKAACHMQDLWNETVLAEVQGIRDPKAISDMLMGKDGGLVPDFVKGPAAPFIGRDARRGYYRRNMAGKTLPFNSGFLAYLTKRSISAKSEQSLYKVRIDGLPTDTNPEAGVPPHMTRLELQCSGSVQTLNYLNYPASRLFEWNPDECGDVVLQVGIGDLTLKRVYNGPRAFPRFLKEFEKGHRTLGTTDFPEASSTLKRMGVRFIKVRYKMSGNRSVASVLGSDAGKAPETIVSCSD